MNWEFLKELYIEKLNNLIYKMKKYILVGITLFFILSSCSVKYNFTGTGKIDAKTFQVNRFMNNAALVQPGVDRDFTLKLQDVIQSQTNLSLTNANGDLVYEGEITDYYISPMTATADQASAQSRLTVKVNVRFVNHKKEEDNFEKSFSFFYDYPAGTQLSNTELTKALDVIFTRITQDIFNDSLAKW